MEDRPGGKPPSAIPIEAIVEAIPVGIAISDPTGTSLFANAAARRLDLAAHDAGMEQPVVQRDRLVVEVDGIAYGVTTSIDVTARRRAEEHLVRRAYYDGLTGLPNRWRLEETVAGLIDAADVSTRFALAFIDIDNFQHINDYHGHGVGDGLLDHIARRVADDLRESDLLARVGGDEFVLLLRPVADDGDLTRRIERLSSRLKQPVFIDGYEIVSSASIGVSLYPQHGLDYQNLRAAADSAMHKIKSASKGGIKVYDPEIGRIDAARTKMEQRLRLAIRDRRLCCAFQPKVDFRSDKVVGLEVLLRWRDEEGAIHAPGEFLKLAVELGLMDEITLMVLDETIEKIDWINQAFGPDTSISINVAPKQAGDLAFMTTFTETLLAAGQAGRFMVELTEEAYLAKSAFQSRILPMLRAIGTRVSIDDFGVGYSSLSALADITADEIKVDRSFITDIHKRPRNQSILKVIESLGQALGMSVIVEGVETFEELAYLEAATRIRFAQGFYFAKPVMLEDGWAMRGEVPQAREARASRLKSPNRVSGVNRRD